MPKKGWISRWRTFSSKSGMLRGECESILFYNLGPTQWNDRGEWQRSMPFTPWEGRLDLDMVGHGQ